MTTGTGRSSRAICTSLLCSGPRTLQVCSYLEAHTGCSLGLALVRASPPFLCAQQTTLLGGHHLDSRSTPTIAVVTDLFAVTLICVAGEQVVFPTRHKFCIPSPALHKPAHTCHLRSQEAEDQKQKFKVILSSIVSSKPAWARHPPFSLKTWWW